MTKHRSTIFNRLLSSRSASGRALLVILIALTLVSPLPRFPVRAGDGVPRESTTLSSGDTKNTTFNAGDPINAASGEYHFVTDLFDLGGVLPLTYRLYYGSQVDSKRLLDGLPFRFISNQRLTLVVAKFHTPQRLRGAGAGTRDRLSPRGH